MLSVVNNSKINKKDNIMFMVMAGMMVAQTIMQNREQKAQAEYMRKQQEWENKQRLMNTFAQYQTTAKNSVLEDKDALRQQLALQAQEEKDKTTQKVMTAFNGLAGASVADANSNIETQYKLARSEYKINREIAKDNYKTDLASIQRGGQAAMKNQDYRAPSLGSALLATGINIMAAGMKAAPKPGP